jgi:hypothetical protein
MHARQSRPPGRPEHRVHCHHSVENLKEPPVVTGDATDRTQGALARSRRVEGDTTGAATSRVKGDFALDRRRQGQDLNGSTVADVPANAASGAGIGIDAIGQGPCTAPCVLAHQPNGTGRTEPGAGVATRAGRRVYDRCKGDEMLGGRGREVPSGNEGLGVFTLRLGVRPTSHLVHRRTDRLAEEGPAVEGGPWLSDGGGQGAPPGVGPECHDLEPGEPPALQHPPDGLQVGADARHPAPGTGIAIPMTQHQARHALGPQGQQGTQAQGMDARQDTGVPDLENNLAGGIGHKLAADPMTGRTESVTDGPLRAGRGAEPAAVAALGIDSESLVVEHEGRPGTGIDAGPARRLLQMGMHAALGYDLGRQEICRIKARIGIEPEPAGSVRLHPGRGQPLR